MTSQLDSLIYAADQSEAELLNDDSIRFYKEVAPLVNEIGRTMCVALDQGHAVVLVVTETTRAVMEEQLTARGIDVDRAQLRGQYVCLDAIETLPRVVLNGAPDASRFVALIGGLLDQLEDEYKRVWMFSELSAAMWYGATRQARSNSSSCGARSPTPIPFVCEAHSRSKFCPGRSSSTNCTSQSRSTCASSRKTARWRWRSATDRVAGEALRRGRETR